jgi:hypothetical protein
MLIPLITYEQGYLHTDGIYIRNGSNNEVILRGIGTGNWMLQEGYMMQTSDVAPTQHEFRDILIETIGETNTDSFYNAWLASHFTRTDVDSMKSWGFNSIRVAMHYKLFTLPIENEPIPGENTWLDKGFLLLDSLLDWCSNDEMYLILDLHGAPGGQGTDAAISDYDPLKPSLWESQQNKDKTIALWHRLAERYSNKPWIGGYDLINETNWDFGDTNNSALWDLLIDITESIREVDQNHMIIIEGNWFANDYTGVPMPWDDNLIFSFHKYWTLNNSSSLDWIINLRNSYNVPIWLGESGENSNCWFTSLIALCEENHIGWSWWPVKKPQVNNPLNVKVNEDYLTLVDSWRGNATAPTPEEAFQVVLQFAASHKIENCTFQKDVVDAMIRQPFSAITIPYQDHKPGHTIFASDFDLGRNNYAYFDHDTSDIHLSTGSDWTDWNQGWSYRNDGVDIEACSDAEESNGYNVGWAENGEWLQYTIITDSLAAYSLHIRYASNTNGGVIRFLADGIPVTGNIDLSGTGGWQNWESLVVKNVIVPVGTIKIRLLFESIGLNINYFKFSDPVTISSIEFLPVYAETSTDGTCVFLYLNKNIVTQAENILTTDFEFTADASQVDIQGFSIDDFNPNILIINLYEPVYYGSTLELSYIGSSVQSSTDTLESFTGMEVVNKLPRRFTIPCRIQAEDYCHNNGFELENCEDTGDGYNTAYASTGDYLDYLVYVPESGAFDMNFRVATIRNNAELIIQSESEEEFTSLDTILFTSTGGWQNWQTQSTRLTLDEGRYTLRLLVKQGEHNLNWFEIVQPSLLIEYNINPKIILYPNPAQNNVIIEVEETVTYPLSVSIYNTTGNLLQNIVIYNSNKISLNTSMLNSGLYPLTVNIDKNKRNNFTLLISR